MSKAAKVKELDPAGTRELKAGEKAPVVDESEPRKPLTEEELVAGMHDQLWRLNNLYYVVDEDGRRVQFKLRWEQRALYKNMWFFNVVLKARQLGMSTFILIYMLDSCLFNDNISAGVIAHSKDDAKILFRDKIKYAYDNLPPQILKKLGSSTRSAQELVFPNNSSIRVATSMRSGTLQLLHVSEFGKICRKYPDKAREIVTGSFETVHPGQQIFVESTAEGREGGFYEMCKLAKAAHDAKKVLSKLDFKFHFFPWWRHPKNVLDPTNVIIFPKLWAYFEEIKAKYGITLTAGQKAWYAKKWTALGDDLKREHPSRAEEAFEQSIEGAYFARAMAQARQDGRLCHVPHQVGYMVDTWWDLGMNDTTVIWFTQTVGLSVHVIDYYETSGENLQHYAKMLGDRADEKHYHYGRHVWPHDGGHRKLGLTKLTLDMQAAQIGLYVEVQPRGDLVDGIETTRNFISQCWFDETLCDDGIKGLDSYRKEWDERLGCWKRTPLHDWASNPADALRTLARAYKTIMEGTQKQAARTVVKAASGGWT